MSQTGPFAATRRTAVARYCWSISFMTARSSEDGVPHGPVVEAGPADCPARHTGAPPDRAGCCPGRPSPAAAPGSWSGPFLQEIPCSTFSDRSAGKAGPRELHRPFGVSRGCRRRCWPLQAQARPSCRHGSGSGGLQTGWPALQGVLPLERGQSHFGLEDWPVLLTCLLPMSCSLFPSYFRSGTLS